MRGLAHDLDVRIALQEAPDALTHEFVVVEEKDADGHRSIVPAAHARTWPLRRVGSRSVASARGVPYTRVSDPEKLRRLLAAVLVLTSDVELPELLRTSITEACSLVDARYGALGVLNERRTGLEQFLTVGLDEEQERAIGARPTGRGVLGPLITDPCRCGWIGSASTPTATGFLRIIPR